MTTTTIGGLPTAGTLSVAANNNLQCELFTLDGC